MNASSLPLDNYGLRHQTDKHLPGMMLVPTALFGLGWALEGAMWAVDIGFCVLTTMMVVLLIREIRHFSSRFGAGGLLFFGGVLIWFCDDYFRLHGFGANPNPRFSAEIVAKAAFFHGLFLFCMAVGFLLPYGRWLERTMRLVPEPSTPEAYFWITVILFGVSIAPYAVFSRHSLPETMYRAVMGKGVSLTGGRTGRMNVSWTAYQSQIREMGQFVVILGMYYALILSRSFPKKLCCVGMWAFWVLTRFHETRRGPVVFMVMPVACLLFLKYEALANLFGRHIRRRAFLYAGLVGFAGLFAVLVQGQFRASHQNFFEIDVTELKPELQGNSMFSATLPAFEQIPEHTEHFRNRFPGEGLLRPIPDKVFALLIGPIPRALWRDKPVDKAEEWYNLHLVGRQGGTTVSPGAVGEWYMKYGIFGVLQGGILFGWLMVVAERTIQNARGRTMVILFALAFMTFLFRSYRDLWVHNLYPIVIGGLAIRVVIAVFWPPKHEALPQLGGAGG